MTDVSDPAAIRTAFEWEVFQATVNQNVATKFLNANANRIALVIFNQATLDFLVLPSQKVSGTVGFRLTPTGAERRFLFKDFGAMVSTEWWGFQSGFFPITINGIEVTYRPELLKPIEREDNVSRRFEDRNGDSDIRQIDRLERNESTDSRSVSEQDDVDFLAAFLRSDVSELRGSGGFGSRD